MVNMALNSSINNTILLATMYKFRTKNLYRRLNSVILSTILAITATSNHAADNPPSQRGACKNGYIESIESPQASNPSRTISHIELDKEPIFNSLLPEENKTIHQLANRFHRMTKDSVILRQLPFKAGDAYQPADIAEAERILRANAYWSEVSIEPIEEPNEQCDHSVVLKVTTKEVWSIIPSARYTSIDGENTLGVSVTDVNFLGLGQTLSLGYTDDEGAVSVWGSLFAPYLINHSVDLFTSVTSGEETDSTRLSLIKPFRDYEDKSSYGLEIQSAEFEQNQYLRSEAFYAYNVTLNYANLFWGGSQGVNNDKVARWRVGITRDFREFDDQINILTGDGPITDRKRLYPWISWQHFNTRFAKLTNIRHLHRTEDIFIGQLWNMRVGYADDEADTETDYLLLDASVDFTPLITQKQLMNLRFSADTHWATEENSGENSFFTAELRYYWLHNTKQRTHFYAQRTVGRSLTIDRLLTQGGNYGLRGYPEFYQVGNERYRLHLEHRYYFQQQLLNLIQFASALYVDAGRAWFSEPTFGTTEYDGDEMLWNIGLGLRIASNRVGQGSIAHIDIAFPMTDAPDLTTNQVGETPEDWRFTLELKSTF